VRRSCEGEGGYRPYARTVGSISTIYRVLRAAEESRERRALAKLLLVRNTVLLAAAIFACNALLHHSWIESLLFATRDRDRAHAAAPASAKNHVPSLCGGIGDSARGRFDKDRRRSRPSRLLRRQGWHPAKCASASEGAIVKGCNGDGAHDARRSEARSSKARTSSLVTCEKSSYHAPTPPNGSAVS
jgi:hypothetical protein